MALALVAGSVATEQLVALSPDKSVDQLGRAWWTRVDGLPQTAVQALGRSDPGYLWIGTQEGLARFEGERFMVFRSEGTAELRSDFITSLKDAGDGGLWVGTRQGLVRFERGSFVALGSAQGLTQDYIRVLEVAQDGSLWVGTAGGGVFFTRDQGASFSSIPELAGSVVRALLSTPDGSVWVGTSTGLQRLSAQGEVRPFVGEELFVERSVRALTRSSDGAMWIGLEDGHLARWQDGVVEEIDLGVGGIAALLEDRDGALWVAAARGVLRRSGDGRWDSLTEIEPDAVPAYSLFEDRGGSVWVGTRHGLLRLRDGSVTVFGERQGLVDTFVRTVSADSAGRLWVGSSQGLAVREQSESVFRRIALPAAHSEARALLLDGERVWLGSRAGVLEGSWQGRRVIWRERGPQGVTVDVIARDPEGRLWVGTQGDGLLRSDASGRQWSDLLAGQVRAKRVVRALAWSPARGTRSARMWIGTEGGLLFWDGTTVVPFSFEHGLRAPALSPEGDELSVQDQSQPLVLALHLDDRGDLWIGTAARGLGHLKLGGAAGTESVEAVWIDHRAGLFDNLVFQILDDGAGNFWMTCNRGISLVTKAELRAVVEGRAQRVRSRWFDESDGLLNAECNGGTQPAGWVDSEQNIWVPTVEGLARLRVEDASADSSDPGAVWVETVLLNRFEVEPRPDGRYVLPPGNRNVEIRYASAGHLSSAQSEFEYRLEGFDPEWVAAGMRRAAVFTNLPPGDYRFEVRAVSRFGTVRTAEPLILVAQPWLFERAIVRWCTALLVAALIAGFVRWRARAGREQRERLRQQVEERTSELAIAMRDLERLATQDALTEIANPRHLHDHLAAEWSRAQRSGQPISCLMLDVDHFKEVNDRLGHAAGDEVLKTIASTLRAHARREGELLARRGGDEFAVVLPGSSLEVAKALAELMRSEVEAALAALMRDRGWPPELAGSLSIGVATCVASHEAAASHLLDLADKAVYRAKRDGRNRVSV